VWEIPLSNGGNVLALTVPEIGQKGNSAALKRLTEAKNKLNDLIKGYKRENLYVLSLGQTFDPRRVLLCAVS
jgi:hypothetical protein